MSCSDIIVSGKWRPKKIWNSHNLIMQIYLAALKNARKILHIIGSSDNIKEKQNHFTVNSKDLNIYIVPRLIEILLLLKTS